MSESFSGGSRMDKRLHCCLKGSFQDGASLANECAVENISAGGAGLLTATPLSVDEGLILQISEGLDQIVAREATVRWCKRALNGWRSGIAFNQRIRTNLKEIR